QGADRRLLAVGSEVDGGGDRMGEALSQPHGERQRHRDPGGLRPGGIRTHSRAGEEARLTMAKAGAGVWVGRVISWLAVVPFVMSRFMKFMGGPKVQAGFEHLGLPTSMMLPLGLLEVACVAIYLVPATAVLGAVLLTGFIGGAICTHWRVGDPFYVHILIG